MSLKLNMNLIEFYSYAALSKEPYMLSNTLSMACIQVPESKSVLMGWLSYLLGAE